MNNKKVFIIKEYKDATHHLIPGTTYTLSEMDVYDLVSEGYGEEVPSSGDLSPRQKRIEADFANTSRESIKATKRGPDWRPSKVGKAAIIMSIVWSIISIASMVWIIYEFETGQDKTISAESTYVSFSFQLLTTIPLFVFSVRYWKGSIKARIPLFIFCLLTSSIIAAIMIIASKGFYKGEVGY